MKKLIAFTIGCFMVSGLAINANAGTRAKCKISAVKGTAVIMDCGDKTSTLKAGTEVTLKTIKAKQKTIEGC